MWDRASEVEYDAWEKLGSPGWNWKNLYHYMKKSEEFTAPPASDAEKLHIAPNSSDYGSSGPVKVSFPRYVSEQVQNWIPALQSLGIPKNDDPLAGNNVGASVQPSNIDPYNSTRSYSAPAYLFPNAARPNLAVQTDALVTKINFAPALSSKADLKATGISFVSGSKTYTVKVNKEVIVAGGSVNTPAILEHSGIGNKTILAKAGVKQLIDLPAVGENLQDHSYSSAAYELKDGHVTLDTLRNNATFAREQTDLYKANKTSILDETVPAIAYVSLPKLVGNETADQLIAEAAAYVEQSTAPYKATLQMQIDYLQNHPDTVSQMELIGIDGYFATSGAPVPNKTYITYLAAQQHLLSRGTVHINSSDATVYPVISPNYYSVPFDVKVATAGTAYMRKIAGAEQYASYIAKEAVPGEGADLQNYTTTVGFTTEYHPIGTASMLPRNKGGVVDPTLKVYGTCNVRVVDASIIPVHISAHIQATVYGVAEFAADIIRGKSIL